MAKNVRKLFAMLLTVCMVMSLLSIGASAEGEEIVPEGNFSCGMELHVHNADCYTPKLDCEKHVHVEGCYDEEGLTCTLLVGRDLNCDGHTAHDENCYATVEHGDSCYTENKTLNCTVPGCTHPTDACYSVTKNLKCEETHLKKVCTVEDEDLHVHTDACYVDHVHIEYGEPDSCYKAELTCELPEHPAHTESCLSPTGKGIVDAVIQQMTDAPELQAMQDARGTTYADGTADYPTADAAAAAYNTFIDGCFTEREAALKAYQDMPDELKGFVPEALVTKLTTPLANVFLPETASITKGENGYTFQAVYSPAYEMSHHWVANEDGSHAEGPQTFILVEADKDKSWTMDGPYAANGTNNYELAYCSDIETMLRGGTHYKRINLEESSYYGELAAQRIRAIVMNSYPFVTLETMKAALKKGGFADADALNRSEIIAAVQTAIWYCANSDSMQPGFGYFQTLDLNNFPSGWGRMVHNHCNEMYEWWNVGSKKYCTNAEAGARIDGLVAYLLAMPPVEPEPEEIIITEVSIEEVEAVLAFGGLYEVVLKVVLNSTGNGKVDDLTLTATVGTGVDATVVTMDVVDGQTEYYMLVPAWSGDEITVEVSGTQTLPRGVYFYEPEPADIDPDGPNNPELPDGVATAREASQNLVGVAMGATSVYAKDSVTFETDEVVYATGGLQVQKVDGWGTPLTGAEFTLHTDVDNDGDMDPFKTYTVNEQGYVVNDYGYEGIVDLIPDKTYELTESKAPDGYTALGGAARFEIVMDGENAVVHMIGLPYGMSYEADEAGLKILKVVNVPKSSGGGPIITPNLPEEEIEDGDVPLGQLPDEELEIPEEDVPLAELPEEDVPLAMAPATGDAAVIWTALSALSGAGLFLTRKKREDEE